MILHHQQQRTALQCATKASKKRTRQQQKPSMPLTANAARCNCRCLAADAAHVVHAGPTL